MSRTAERTYPSARKSVANQKAAVRCAIYTRKSTAEGLDQELERRTWVAKQWTTKRGDMRGGKLFTKKSLFRLLTNVVYTGNVSYKETIYRGEHEGIVNPDLWQRVQDTLRHNGRSGGKEIRNKYGALLRGFVIPWRISLRPR